MDLMNLQPTTDTVTILLKHPVTDEILKKDDGTEMSITMYATHSKEYKAAMHEQTNKRLLKSQKAKKNVIFTAEDIDSSTIEVLAKSTKEWDLQFNKKPLKFTIDEAINLYQKFPWIKEQVSEAQEDFTSFLKA